jgi:hypothetical protein
VKIGEVGTCRRCGKSFEVSVEIEDALLALQLDRNAFIAVELRAAVENGQVEHLKTCTGGP